MCPSTLILVPPVIVKLAFVTIVLVPLLDTLRSVALLESGGIGVSIFNVKGPRLA